MKYSRNPFLADPTGAFEGRPAGGTEAFPGFHTTKSMSIAVPYAQGKISHALRPAPRAWDTTLTDYPVIIELDMRGLRAEIDYDGAVLMDALPVIAEELLKLEGRYAESLRGYMSDGQADDDVPDKAYDALLYITAPTTEPAGALLGLLEDRNEEESRSLLRKLARGDSNLLMRATDQFRYTQDIGDDRLVAVHYMRPFWEDVIDTDSTRGAKLADRLESNGWDVLAADYADSTSSVGTITEVWRDQKQRYFPWLKDRRTEYHGTSYKNLIRVVPWIYEVLPIPPKPYVIDWGGRS